MPGKFLVAFDFSPPAKRALDFGLVVAEGFGVSLEMVVVVHPRLFFNSTLPRHPRALKEAALAEILSAKERLGAYHPEIRVVCLKGWPSARIVEYGVSCGASLVLIGKAGHGASRGGVGLVAGQVLSQALTSVGVVP